MRVLRELTNSPPDPDTAHYIHTLQSSNSMTISIQTALLTTQLQLEGHSDAPQREAEWLIEHITGQRQSLLIPNETVALTAHQAQQLTTLISRRIAGEPLAYVLGEQPFWTLNLKVDPAVLIPRPETELLVERTLHHLSKDRHDTLLELGTGSGAVALAIATERPNLHIVATDYSIAALNLARSNAALNNLSNIHFLHSNWFIDIPPQTFSVILSNPPYIAEDDPHVDQSVRNHEPHLALFSGSDGMNALRQIIHSSPSYLSEGGWLILEHGWQQAAPVREILESVGFSSVASHPDLTGHLRITEGQWLTSNPVTLSINH